MSRLVIPWVAASLFFAFVEGALAANMPEALLRNCPTPAVAMDFSGLVNPMLARCLRDCGELDLELNDCVPGTASLATPIPYRLMNPTGELSGFFTSTGSRCSGGVFDSVTGEYPIPAAQVDRDRCPIRIRTGFVPLCPSESAGGAPMAACKAALSLRFVFTIDRIGAPTNKGLAFDPITTDDIKIPTYVLSPGQILRQNASSTSCPTSEVAIGARPDGTPICAPGKEDDLLCATLLTNWAKAGCYPATEMAKVTATGEVCHGAATLPAGPTNPVGSIYTQVMAMTPAC